MASDRPKDVLHVRVTMSKPSADAAKAVAAELKKLGFAEIVAGTRGVDFEANKADIEQKLQTVISENQHGSVFASEPVFPEPIKDYVKSTYFPKKPKLFE